MLKTLLKDKKITQAEFAKKLNVTQSLVSQWANGKCEPNIATIKSISKILSLSVEQIIECFN